MHNAGAWRDVLYDPVLRSFVAVANAGTKRVHRMVVHEHPTTPTPTPSLSMTRTPAITPTATNSSTPTSTKTPTPTVTPSLTPANDGSRRLMALSSGPDSNSSTELYNVYNDNTFIKMENVPGTMTNTGALGNAFIGDDKLIIVGRNAPYIQAYKINPTLPIPVSALTVPSIS